MQFLSYLIRRCAGPKDEVPGEILPREVESSSRRLSLPWRHKKQLERQEGEEVPADTRRAPHVSRVSSETWPLPRRLPLALLPCGLYLWTFFSVYNQHGMRGTGCTFLLKQHGGDDHPLLVITYKYIKKKWTGCILLCLETSLEQIVHDFLLFFLPFWKANIQVSLETSDKK